MKYEIVNVMENAVPLHAKYNVLDAGSSSGKMLKLSEMVVTSVWGLKKIIYCSECNLSKVVVTNLF